mgnify:CR=1 FL=1
MLGFCDNINVTNWLRMGCIVDYKLASIMVSNNRNRPLYYVPDLAVMLSTSRDYKVHSNGEETSKPQVTIAICNILFSSLTRNVSIWLNIAIYVIQLPFVLNGKSFFLNS